MDVHVAGFNATEFLWKIPWRFSRIYTTFLTPKAREGLTFPSFSQQSIYIKRQSLVCKVSICLAITTNKLELVCQGTDSLYDRARTMKGLPSNLRDKLSTIFLHVMVSISCHDDM